MKHGWYPIETAPLDGTKVDLWTEYGARAVDQSYSIHKWWNGRPVGPLEWGPYDERPPEPTHWRPIPPPPDDV